MKTNIFCFKLSKTIVVLLTIVIIQMLAITIGIMKLKEEKSFEQIQEKLPMVENKIVQQENITSIKQEDKPTLPQNTLQEYSSMPNQLKGFKVIGKITIPKLKLESYILDQTNTKALKVSITKLCGPEINQVGNFCMAGHNYRNNKMFGAIKKLEVNDKIILTDTFDRSITYRVEKNYQTDPKDVSCLGQDTRRRKGNNSYNLYDRGD